MSLFPIHRLACLLLLSLSGFGVFLGEVTAQEAPDAQEAKSSDSAQSNAISGQGPTRVAVIDMSKLFTENHPFMKKLDQEKAKVREFETALRERNAELQELQAQMKDLVPGSDKYSEIQQKFVREKADLSADLSIGKERFTKSEAKLYGEAYQTIQALVEEYAKEHQIDLVLRATPKKDVETANPETIAQIIGSTIVYQNNLDITEAILKQLNRSAVTEAN